MNTISNPKTDIKWHRLDNTANLFPVISNRNYSNIYRISIRLKKQVVPDILQDALDQTLPRFGTFKVRLRRGFFWYYFEANDKPCMISEESGKPCSYFSPAQNNHYLFRVTYYRARINIEVFHVITDGQGATNFLKELACRYLDLVALKETGATLEPQPSVDVFSDLEDSYSKNFIGKNAEGYSTRRAYRLRGEKMPVYMSGVIHGYVPIKQIIAHCRDNGLTITKYLTSVLIWSIYLEYLKGNDHKHPLSVSIPVNLRPYFDSTSTMNFFSIIAIVIESSEKEYSFDDIVSLTTKQFDAQLTREYFSSKIAYNVAFGKNWMIRFTPLFVKNIVLKMTYLRSSKANTITLSNIGRVKVPDRYKDQIESADLVMGATSMEAIKCAVCSYERSLVITFSSVFKDTYIQKTFFRKLSSDGLDVVIESNGAYYETL